MILVEEGRDHQESVFVGMPFPVVANAFHGPVSAVDDERDGRLGDVKPLRQVRVNGRLFFPVALMIDEDKGARSLANILIPRLAASMREAAIASSNKIKADNLRANGWRTALGCAFQNPMLRDGILISPQHKRFVVFKSTASLVFRSAWARAFSRLRLRQTRLVETVLEWPGSTRFGRPPVFPPSSVHIQAGSVCGVAATVGRRRRRTKRRKKAIVAPGGRYGRAVCACRLNRHRGKFNRHAKYGLRTTGRSRCW